MNKRNFNRNIKENKKFKSFFLKYVKSNSNYWLLTKVNIMIVFCAFKVFVNSNDMNFKLRSLTADTV